MFPVLISLHENINSYFCLKQISPLGSVNNNSIYNNIYKLMRCSKQRKPCCNIMLTYISELNVYKILKSVHDLSCITKCVYTGILSASKSTNLTFHRNKTHKTNAQFKIIPHNNLNTCEVNSRTNEKINKFRF